MNVRGSMGWYVNQIVNEWPGRKLLLGGGESGSRLVYSAFFANSSLVYSIGVFAYWVDKLKEATTLRTPLVLGRT